MAEVGTVVAGKVDPAVKAGTKAAVPVGELSEQRN